MKKVNGRHKVNILNHNKNNEHNFHRKKILRLLNFYTVHVIRLEYLFLPNQLYHEDFLYVFDIVPNYVLHNYADGMKYIAETKKYVITIPFNFFDLKVFFHNTIFA